MPDCPHCAQPIPAGAPACPHCGKVTANEQLSGAAGGFFGCLGSIAALFLWVVVGGSVAGRSFVCTNLWLSAGYDVVTIVVCLAALWSAVRAARRGSVGLALVIVIPAIVVLLPATACAVNTFSTCR